MVWLAGRGATATTLLPALRRGAAGACSWYSSWPSHRPASVTAARTFRPGGCQGLAGGSNDRGGRADDQAGRRATRPFRLGHLVQRGLVSRREDERDRRLKRVAITEQGRQFMATLEQRRVDVQLAVMEYLSAEERAEVVHAMTLLAAAGRRSRDVDRDARYTGAARHP